MQPTEGKYYLNLMVTPRGGGRCLQGNLWKFVEICVTACQYDVTSRVRNFQIGEQSVYRRDEKKFRFYHRNTVPVSWIWRF